MRFHFPFHDREFLWLVACGPTVLLRRNDHDQAPPFHARGVLDRPHLFQLCDDRIHERSAHLLIRHLTTAVRQEDLGLVPIGQKSFNLSNLDLQVMLICPRAQLNFLHLRRFLMTPILMVLFAQLKLVFPVVHNAAHGRHRCRRDLDKVITILLRLLEGISRKENTQLFAVWTDYTNLANPNFSINS